MDCDSDASSNTLMTVSDFTSPMQSHLVNSSTTAYSDDENLTKVVDNVMYRKSFSNVRCKSPIKSQSTLTQNQRNDERNVYSKLCTLLQCPVCFEIVQSPIYQCVNGHILCHQCLPHLQCRCPICRVDINLPTRNLVLESLLSFFTFSCQFSRCNAIVPFTEMHLHEKECSYRPLKCPCPGCQWTGIDVFKHIIRGHPRILHMDGEQIVFLATELDIPGKRLNWLMIQRCFNQHFLLWLEKCHYQKDPHLNDDNQSESTVFYWATVQLICADKLVSKQFRYRLELEQYGENPSKFSWESKVKCVGQSRQEILKSNDCLVLSGKLIENFIQNKRLPLNVTIIRDK